MSLIRPTNDEARLARWAREQASGLSALFHGTRHLSCILSDGYLKSTGNPAMVRFSRSADAAAYWAMMERDDDDGRGAILVFDRDRLRTRYRLELIDESLYIAEQEECIPSRNVPLGLTLIGIISEQFRIRPREIRHDVWHRRVYGVGTIPWTPSMRVLTRSDSMPRADLRRLTKRLRRSAKPAQKRAANPISASIVRNDHGIYVDRKFVPRETL
jgi:hypothetical protein